MEKQAKGNKVIIALIAIAVVLIITLIVLIVYHSGNKDIKNDIKKDGGVKVSDDMVAVYQIELTVVSPSSNNIHFVRYPYYYISTSDDNDLIDLELDYKTQKYVPKEDVDFFLNFIENNNTADKTEDSVLTYCLRVTCYKGDSSDIDTMKVAYGYDVFPEELNEVIDRMNKLCKADLVEYPTEVIDDVPSFVYQDLGISEDDYPREDIEKMIDDYGFLAMDEMFSDTRGFIGMMSNYYGSISEENIQQYISNDLRESTEISDKDYTEFVNKYVAELGDEWQISSEIDCDGLTMIVKHGSVSNGYVYIGKAELVNEWKKNGDLQLDYDDKYVYMMPAGGEGMTKTTEFIYNKDASVILLDYKCAGKDYDECVELFYNLRD